jgi:hypothetical protein
VGSGYKQASGGAEDNWVGAEEGIYRLIATRQVGKVRNVVSVLAPSGSFDFVTHDETVLHRAQDDGFIARKGYG